MLTGSIIINMCGELCKPCSQFTLISLIDEAAAVVVFSRIGNAFLHSVKLRNDRAACLLSSDGTSAPMRIMRCDCERCKGGAMFSLTGSWLVVVLLVVVITGPGIKANAHIAIHGPSVQSNTS